jgi:hypothetical protein
VVSWPYVDLGRSGKEGPAEGPTSGRDLEGRKRRCTMDRHTSELLHDRSAHDAMSRFVFLAGIVAVIVVLHRILYHVAF